MFASAVPSSRRRRSIRTSRRRRRLATPRHATPRHSRGRVDDVISRQISARERTRLAHLVHVPVAVRRRLRLQRQHARHAPLPGLRQGLRHHVRQTAAGRRPGSRLRFSHLGEWFTRFAAAAAPPSRPSRPLAYLPRGTYLSPLSAIYIFTLLRLLSRLPRVYVYSRVSQSNLTNSNFPNSINLYNSNFTAGPFEKPLQIEIFLRI